MTYIKVLLIIIPADIAVHIFGERPRDILNVCRNTSYSISASDYLTRFSCSLSIYLALWTYSI